MSIYSLQKKAEKLIKSEKDAELADGTYSDEATPREDAKDATKNMLGTEYVNARKSQISNVGEDVLDSARHRALEWKGLNAAESDGSAEKLINLKNLRKLEPANLTNIQPGQELAALAAHYALEALPKEPKVKLGRGWAGTDDNQVIFHEHRSATGKKMMMSPSRSASAVIPLIGKITMGDLKREARSHYLNTYRSISAKAEELLSDPNNNHPEKIIEGIVNHASELLNDQRAKTRKTHTGPSVDSYLSNNLVDYINKHRSWKTKKGSATDKMENFYKALQHKHGKDITTLQPGELGDSLRTHMNDIISAGKSLRQSFDIPKEDSAGTRKKKLSRGDLYTGELALSGSKRPWNSHDDHVGHLLDHVKLRGVQYGNSVSDAEREHHTKMVAHSFADLTDVLGLPGEMGSFNGRLAVAIGARGKGKALAHYEPSLNVINMTRKNGVGTLAHEWGHFFDHIVAKVAHEHDGYGSDYHNLGTVKMQMTKETGKRKELHDAYTDLMGSLQGTVKKRILKDYYDRHPQLESVNNLSKYWLSNREMFARAFEKHIEGKLAKNKKENTYLSSSPDHVLWPSKVESDDMEAKFDKLFDVFKNSEYLKKSLDFMEKAYKKGGRWFPEHKDKGKSHPEDPTLVGHVDKADAATWAHEPGIIENQSNQIIKNYGKANMSPAGKSSLRNLIKHVASDPDHGSVKSGSSPGSVGDYSEIRLRHIHKALAGRDGHSINENPDGSLTIHAERHSTNKNNPWKSTTWHFDGKNSLKSVKKDPIRNVTSEGSYDCGQQKLRKERNDGIVDSGAVGGVRRRVQGSGTDRRRDEGKGSKPGGASGVLRKGTKQNLAKALEMVGGTIEMGKSEEPEDLNKGAKGDWQKEGYTIRHGNRHDVFGDDSDNYDRSIVAEKDGKQAGYALLNVNNNDMSSHGTTVHPEHQRKGLASAMYNFAERQFNKKMTPGAYQSSEAEAMWDQPNRKEKFGKSLEDLEKAIPEGSYVFYADLDNAGSLVEKAVMKDDINSVKGISNRIALGGKIVAQFVKNAGGELFVSGGDDSAALMPIGTEKSLESLKNTIHKQTGFTITIGYGSTNPQAVKALVWGKTNGKNQVSEWTSDKERYIIEELGIKSAKEKAKETFGE